MSAQFSVIIPTLQRSPVLPDVVRVCAEHPSVLEVLIINNAPAPLTFESPKVRVLAQSENLYVNPAWNLGVREARGELLAIINDDVLFEPEALTYSAKVLRRPFFGIVGPDQSTFWGEQSGRISHRPARTDVTVRWFGTFMCLRKKDYVPIPEELRIWAGDDWLIAQQRRPPAVLIRTTFTTDMHTTTSSVEFQRMREAEDERAKALLTPLHGRRWWHRPQVQWTRLRQWAYRASLALRRKG